MQSEIKIFPPQDFTAFCGCKVRFDNDGLVRWEQCKLHNSTPQLLAERDALRAALAALLSDATTEESCWCLGKSDDCPNPPRCEACQARAALALSQPERGNE